MTTPFEVPTKFDQSELPSQLPADSFSYPFYAQIFEIAWSDQSAEDLVSIIPKVVGATEPIALFQQRAIFDPLFEEDAAKRDANIEWHTMPHTFEVDEEGLIRAVIGTIQGYKTGLMEILDDENFLADLSDSAYIALSQAEVGSRIFRSQRALPVTYHTQLDMEFERRQELRIAREAAITARESQATLF